MTTIDEMEKLLAEATKGPWRREALGGSSTVIAAGTPVRNDTRIPAYAYDEARGFCIAYPHLDDRPQDVRLDFVHFSHADAALIVAAINSLPALLACARAVEQIAEGNLGDASWQADYERIREVARSALDNLEKQDG